MENKYNDLYIWCRNENTSYEKYEQGWNKTKELIRICKLLTDQDPTIEYKNWYIIGIDKPKVNLENLRQYTCLCTQNVVKYY